MQALNKLFFRIAAWLLFYIAPVWYTYVFVDDLLHPEIWDKDWTHDPRFYWPGLVLVVPFWAMMTLLHITEKKR